MNADWSASTLSDLEKSLNTDLNKGLSSKEARKRLASTDKKNIYSLFAGNRKSVVMCLLSSAEMPFLVLLLIVSLLTAIFGRAALGISVFTVTAIAAVLCAILSLKNRKILNVSREYASPMVRVRRSGSVYFTDSRNLVRGDVIILGEGDLVPCDARVIKCSSLVVDELFIGDNGLEKRRLTKHADDLASQDCCIFAGSAVLEGQCVALVLEVGSGVELAEFVPVGALSGRDGESECARSLKKPLYKISFVCAAALLVLTLLALITFSGKESLICSFTALLSVVFLINFEMLNLASDYILSSFIGKLFKSKSTKKKLDNSAVIRSIKALDTLTGITDVILVGSAGIDRGVYRVSQTFIGEKTVENIDPADPKHLKLLDLVYMYTKAMKIGQPESTRSDSTVDALHAFLRSVNYDASATDIMIRSLYTATDAKLDLNFACIETDADFCRAALFENVEHLHICKRIRDNNSIRDITDDDKIIISEIHRECKQKSEKCLFCISESDSGVIFEGVLVLEQPASGQLRTLVSEFRSLDINVSVFLPNGSRENKHIAGAPDIESIFNGRIAFADNNGVISGLLGRYNVFVGYSNEEYSAFISTLRKNGAKVAIFGVDNRFNEVMANADITISCDTIQYSTEKHRESVYDRVLAEGCDDSARASQRTRLLSKVIVKRAHNLGGGLLSILKAIKMSRSAYISLGQSLLLFVLLMSSLATFTAMSVVTGCLLLDPLQTTLLSVSFAFISILIFTDSQYSSQILSQKIDYLSYPYNLLKKSAPDILARVFLAAITAIVIRIMNSLGAFGDKPGFTLPIFLCLCFTLLAEFFLISSKLCKKGEGRAFSYLKLTIALAVMIFICALSIHKPLSIEFYPNGIGSYEFIVVPVYAIAYCITVLVLSLVKKARKKK